MCLVSPHSCFLGGFVGLISRYPEPQPKAWPNVTGHRTGLFPGDGPAESTCHPLQEWVRANVPREKSAAADSPFRNVHRSKYLKKHCVYWFNLGICGSNTKQNGPCLGSFH